MKPLALILFACVINLALGAAPRIEPLVPGLIIKRLPVNLTNIDSVEYGFDGRLYAAGYDGRIHVLTDTDGDGVEETVTPFWPQQGELLTPVGILPRKEGVYVAARGKIALLRDLDQDGMADISEIVVSGWERETVNSDTRNDAAGLAIDAEGNLYFSLGCMSYNKAWQLDADGRSHYNMQSERGTILKVSPDRSHREIVSTGMRFVVGMDFNKHGDLFATDQEGDTWFPGGNPRDELLHIIPGRHYGFPFRHPEYLPNSIDEPYIVGFAPQHQSTCGFRFNETRNNRKQFGPDSWEGNAIVTGFSRGKLWRVPLAKTRTGYVGKQVQIVAFESLPTDVAISPDGDLLVTCHSGRPDWGAGPGAIGHLYKIKYDRSVPQPVLAWASNPLEVKIAFDRPLNKKRLGQAEIEAGEFVWEGDRYEWIWPGYEVAKAAKQAPRHPIPVHHTSLSEDGRTLTLTTNPQPWRSRYAITLDGIAARDSDARSSSRIELSYDLGGATASWIAEGESRATWSGWVPHLDTHVIRAITRGSIQHEDLFHNLSQEGQLTMNSLLMLPGKNNVFRFESDSPFSITCGEIQAKSESAGKRYAADILVRNTDTFVQAYLSRPFRQGDPNETRFVGQVDLEVKLQTGPGLKDGAFDLSVQADHDPYERPVRLEQLKVPWAPAILPTERRELGEWATMAPGDAARGREIFFGTQAACSTCHRYGDEGGNVAADLTVSIHRSPESVLQDIIKPNAAINPDYVNYEINLKDGENITGLLKTISDSTLTVVDAIGNVRELSRGDIQNFRASSQSLMPEGFEGLGKENLRDLVAFLCNGDRNPSSEGLGAIGGEIWFDIKGTRITDLTRHPNFPNMPSGKSLFKRFEITPDQRDNYGIRIRGYIHPPQSGNYVFWVAADDSAELWLSTSDAPADKHRIVQLNSWTNEKDWNAYPQQKSNPIRLDAGKRYYIEALQKEATSLDCLAVGWQLPNGTLERPIPGSRLSTIEEEN